MNVVKRNGDVVPFDKQKIIDAIRHDKKMTGDKITIVF